MVAGVKPLSILHTESSIGWGGQELRILTEMEGMAARGHRVHLVTAGSADILPAARARGLGVDGLPIAAKKLPGLLDVASAHGPQQDVQLVVGQRDRVAAVAVQGRGRHAGAHPAHGRAAPPEPALQERVAPRDLTGELVGVDALDQECP